MLDFQHVLGLHWRVCQGKNDLQNIWRTHVLIVENVSIRICERERKERAVPAR